MIQLRDIVLPLDFNSCIATFSQLPAIDVERCITDALERSAITPLSITLSPEVPPDTPVQKFSTFMLTHTVKSSSLVEKTSCSGRTNRRTCT